MVWHATKLPTVQSLPIHAKIIAQNALLRKESEPRKMQRQLNNSAVPSKAAAAAVQWRQGGGGCGGRAAVRRGDRGHDVEQATQGKAKKDLFFRKKKTKRADQGHHRCCTSIFCEWLPGLGDACTLYIRTYVICMYIGSDKESKPYYCNDVHLQIHSVCY